MKEDKPGINQENFEVELKKKWFPKTQTIITEEGVKITIVEHPLWDENSREIL